MFHNPSGGFNVQYVLCTFSSRVPRVSWWLQGGAMDGESCIFLNDGKTCGEMQCMDEMDGRRRSLPTNNHSFGNKLKKWRGTATVTPAVHLLCGLSGDGSIPSNWSEKRYLTAKRRWETMKSWFRLRLSRK
jgi:hypothetical protein